MARTEKNKLAPATCQMGDQHSVQPDDDLPDDDGSNSPGQAGPCIPTQILDEMLQGPQHWFVLLKHVGQRPLKAA
jgi:hypothetical protein